MTKESIRKRSATFLPFTHLCMPLSIPSEQLYLSTLSAGLLCRCMRCEGCLERNDQKSNGCCWKIKLNKFKIETLLRLSSFEASTRSLKISRA